MSSHPADPDFLQIPGGENLAAIVVDDAPLSVGHGSGAPFGPAEEARFRQLKEDSLRFASFPVQWALSELERGTILESTPASARRFATGPLSKIFVAAAFLNYVRPDPGQLRSLAELMTISSNAAWLDLQGFLGGGDRNEGRAQIHHFTQEMHYRDTRGYQGTWRGPWGMLPGGVTSAQDLTTLFFDLYHEHFAQADTLWKLLFTSRTGENRAKKFLPADQPVGGISGTYAGSAFDPQSGRIGYVTLKHHAVVFELNGKAYALVILNSGLPEEDVALLAGGLYRELAK